MFGHTACCRVTIGHGRGASGYIQTHVVLYVPTPYVVLGYDSSNECLELQKGLGLWAAALVDGAVGGRDAPGVRRAGVHERASARAVGAGRRAGDGGGDDARARRARGRERGGDRAMEQ